MATVYVVTSGEYSDYRIEGTFSAREKAEAFLTAAFPGARRDADDANIEEWTLDEKEGVRLAPTHEVRIELASGQVTSYGGRMGRVGPGDRCRVDGPWPGYRDTTYLNVASPVSEEHAVKVAVEKRQEWLRLNPGPPASGSPAPYNSNRR
jgi:hypothetical protein